MENNYRVSVIETLKKIFKDKSYSNIVINNDMKNIDKRYLSLYRKSVLGVIENLIFIDWIINEVSTTKTKKMELDVLIVLRLAVYQLFFLESSYENAVVNESVQYIKDKGNIRASKFINAVLETYLGTKQLLEKIELLPKDDYLSVKYSYPKELDKKVELTIWKRQDRRSFNMQTILKHLLKLRVNALKISRDELISNIR